MARKSHAEMAPTVKGTDIVSQSVKCEMVSTLVIRQLINQHIRILSCLHQLHPSDLRLTLNQSQ